MSGIGGVLYHDGREVTEHALGDLVDLCAHRGPHGRGLWTSGSVGLGQRLLIPGEPAPPRPRRLELNADGVIVVADARLHNRGELARSLHLAESDASEMSCGDLIRAAYQEWGDRCIDHLLGDFAFAIWDSRARRLFCARDHFGVRPFYYAAPEKAFVFASELKSIRAMEEIDDRVNEVRIAEYLASIILDNSSTFYAGIRRLPPGHTLVVEGGTATTSCYWELGRIDTPNSAPPERLVEEFREIFYEAVRCRMRGDQPLGVLLSGGLDSSTIAGAMMDIMGDEPAGRLHAFSAVFETVRECDESAYVSAVLSRGQTSRHSIQGDEFGPFSDLDRMNWHQEEPYEAPNLFMVWALCDLAKSTGVGVLLDGYDGDTTLSHGQGYLHEMAIAGQWVSLVTQLRGLGAIHGGSAWKAFWSLYSFYALRPLMEKGANSMIGRSLRRARRLVGAGSVAGADEDSPSQENRHINPALARRTELDQRQGEWAKASPERVRSGAEGHHRTITGCVQPFALEVYDRTAAAFSIELAHPFWDKRLVEFSLSLPGELKLDRGWSRMVLRRAMRDVVPENVIWRKSKVDFTPNVRHALMTLQKDQTERLILDGHLEVVSDYVETEFVRDAYLRLRTSKDDRWRSDLFTVWKAVSLALWLRG